MKKFTFILIAFILIPFFSNAQKWKHERLSAYAGIGTNFFFGELGGGSRDASHYFSIRDINWKSTRPVVQVGVRYRLLKDLSIKPTISYALLKGDDATSGNIGRQSRNLHFRSHLWEAGAQFEYFFLKEKNVGRYTFSSYKGINKLSAYFALGGGAFYYNPKSESVRGNGDWQSLRSMKNEGTDYGYIAGYMSVGLGAKYAINNRFAIGIDVSNRYTTTDFLDDASDSYIGSSATHPNFADKHYDIINIDGVQTLAPAESSYPDGKKYRGNPAYNDAYLFTIITGYYKINSVFSMPKY